MISFLGPLAWGVHHLILYQRDLPVKTLSSYQLSNKLCQLLCRHVFEYSRYVLREKGVYLMTLFHRFLLLSDNGCLVSYLL